MPISAREDGRNLTIDLGAAGTFTIPPMPGSHGKAALDLLLAVTFGHSRKQDGLVKEQADTEKLTNMCLGTDGVRGYLRRRKFARLRASHQELVGMAAILWNVHGGSIDAVNDLLDEQDGGYPKALGRVMRSCGLGAAYEALTTWLNGASQALSSATASTETTTTPTGIESTSTSSETAPPNTPQ